MCGEIRGACLLIFAAATAATRALETSNVKHQLQPSQLSAQSIVGACLRQSLVTFSFLAQKTRLNAHRHLEPHPQLQTPNSQRAQPV